MCICVGRRGLNRLQAWMILPVANQQHTGPEIASHSKRDLISPYSAMALLGGRSLIECEMHIHTTCSASQFPWLLLLNWSQDSIHFLPLNFSVRPRWPMQIASALASPATESNRCVCTSLCGLCMYEYATYVSSSCEVRFVGPISTKQTGLDHPIPHPESLS